MVVGVGWVICVIFVVQGSRVGGFGGFGRGGEVGWLRASFVLLRGRIS